MESENYKKNPKREKLGKLCLIAYAPEFPPAQNVP